MTTSHDFHPIIVPALDALIGNPQLIAPKADDKLKAEKFYIPEQYIDQVRNFRNEQSSRGEAAIKLLHDFAKISGEIHVHNNDGYYTCKNSMQIYFMKENELELDGFTRNGSTTHAVAAALSLQKKYSNDEVAILTGDSYTATKAHRNRIDVARINPEVYLGRRKLKLPEELHPDWLNEGRLTAEQIAEAFPNEPSLLINEFVEFELDQTMTAVCGHHSACYDYAKMIGRFEPLNPDEPAGELRALRYLRNLPTNIKPRSAGQTMLLEAMLAPVEEIPIVICPAIFGTGKTFLATAIGLSLVSGDEPAYDKIFVVPRDAELGDDIGFLPGDERAKTIAKAMPIVDSIRNYIKLRNCLKKGGHMSVGDVEYKVEEYLKRYFDFVPLVNMGGRSIEDNWIIYDEAQDMERFQIDQLMKRIGEGSKMIVMGDPNQVYHRHMNYHSNGLMYAASKMAGSPYACVVTMNESEITRSKAACEIAKRFGG